MLRYARETVADPLDSNQHRQRVRWWSVLALLRSLSSSPAAAAATLRTRASTADTETAEEADEIGRHTVLDLVDDDTAEGMDLAPGSDIDEDAGEQHARRRLLEMAREAEALKGRRMRSCNGRSSWSRPCSKTASTHRLLPLHPDRRIRGRCLARAFAKERAGRSR